jgi:hypothetical protein
MKDNAAFGRKKVAVGPAGADVCGFTGAAVQLAIDALGANGGGTVELQEGAYDLIDSVRLRSDIALIGRGQVTLRRSEELISSDLARDADVGQTEIAPARPELFRAGMGVCLVDSSGWAHNNMPLHVTHIEGGRLFLSTMLDVDRIAERGGRVVHYFPIVLLDHADRCLVDNLAVDERVADGPAVEGLWSSGVYLMTSRACTLRRLRTQGVRGDGICIARASLDAVVEDCEAMDNTHHGIHTGSHSARTILRRCHIHDNGSDGLYICWGVDHGSFEDCDIHHNGRRMWRSGLSIGHQDTDNVLAGNHIYENCKYGVCIRAKSEANGAHRNVFRENVIENNGQDPAGMPEFVRKLPARELVSVGASILGHTHDVVFERNVIRETRAPGKAFQKSAFYVGCGVSGLTLRANEFAGHAGPAVVDEAESEDNKLQEEGKNSQVSSARSSTTSDQNGIEEPGASNPDTSSPIAREIERIGRGLHVPKPITESWETADKNASTRGTNTARLGSSKKAKRSKRALNEKCDVCGKAVRGLRGLEDHKRIVHNVIPGHPAPAVVNESDQPVNK